MQTGNVMPVLKIANMRKKEPWMVAGACVELSVNTGKITNVIECRVGGKPELAEGELMVLKIYVRPDGVQHSWPMNPNEVDQVTNYKKAV